MVDGVLWTGVLVEYARAVVWNRAAMPDALGRRGYSVSRQHRAQVEPRSGTRGRVHGTGRDGGQKCTDRTLRVTADRRCRGEKWRDRG